VPGGMRKGLTSYGDHDFSLFLRTAFGTVVLHIAPKAAAGGPLALVRDGDRIRLDVAARRIDLLVGEAELHERAAQWTPPPVPRSRTARYAKLYRDHVRQADEGCDFDFLAAIRT